MPPRKKRVYNEMVEFQKELRQLRMAGSLRCIIHAQQEQINPLCLKKLLEKRWLLQQPQPALSKLKPPSLLWVQYEESPQYLSRKNHSEIHITKIVDVYQNELPNIPDHLFIWPKREPDDPAESYSEYETDHSDYIKDDVEIPLETDSDEAIDFVR